MLGHGLFGMGLQTLMILCIKFGCDWLSNLKNHHVFSPSLYYFLYIENGIILHLNKILFPLLENTLCYDWSKLTN